MRGTPLKDPRRSGQHVDVILDILRDGGAKDVKVFKTKHLIVCFSIGNNPFELRTACTPKNTEETIRQARSDLRRMFRKSLGRAG